MIKTTDKLDTEKLRAELAWAGGKTYELRLRNDEPVEVRLRVILQSEIGEFLDLCLQSEIEALKFCWEVPEGLEYDFLSDESQKQILEANEEVNFTRALTERENLIERAKNQGHGIQSVVKKSVSLFKQLGLGSQLEDTAETSSEE